jgi:hypothetical protein
MKPKVFVPLLMAVCLIAKSCALNPNLFQTPENLKNHALGSNRATILSDYNKYYKIQENPQHPIENLINGNHCSEDWVQGEGFEFRYERYQHHHGRSIVELTISFPKEVRLNRVIVYTVDNAEFPASKYGVSSLVLRYLAGGDIWFPVERVGVRRRTNEGRIQNNQEGIIDFRFKPIKTRAIKLLVYDTNDSNSDRLLIRGVVRLVEIEAYGSEKEITTPSASDELYQLLFDEKQIEQDFKYEYTENFENGLGKWRISATTKYFTVDDNFNYGGQVHSGRYALELSVDSSSSISPFSAVIMETQCSPDCAEYSITAWIYVKERTDHMAGSFVGFSFSKGYVGWSARSHNGSYAYTGSPIGQEWKNHKAVGLFKNSWHQVKVTYYAKEATFSVWVDGYIVHSRLNTKLKPGTSPFCYVIYADAAPGRKKIRQCVDYVTVTGKQ